MSIETLTNMLALLAGPLGPFESIEERDRRTSEWIADGSKHSVTDVLVILIHPPDAKILFPTS